MYKTRIFKALSDKNEVYGIYSLIITNKNFERVNVYQEPGTIIMFNIFQLYIMLSTEWNQS